MLRLTNLPGFFRSLALLCIFINFISCRESERPDTESGSGLYVPENLKAELWAESPLIYNPTSIDIDSRNRVWVTEAVNYRSFNNDSISHMHRSGGDRVVILEDTDGDGKADSSKTFVQDPDLISPVGIAVIGNKVFVSCSPNLIVYTDANGDDKPDSKEIFLTGFGGLDHDHSLHAVYGGPDGLLYFNTGNAGPHRVQDKSGFTLRSGSVYTGGTPYNTENEPLLSDDGKKWVGGLALRINPDGSGLKVLAHNFRNSYDVFVDSYGNLWQNDNDDQVLTCRVAWVMEGGNAGYASTDGNRYWQADQRPAQSIFTAHWHQDDPGVMPAGFNTGAGSPTGVLRIEHDQLGEQFRGLVLSADAGRNMVFGLTPIQQQSGFMPSDKINLISSIPDDNELYVWDDSTQNSDRNKWFRPSDVAAGTDGSLFIADWYDPVVGGHQMNDSIAHGRIYRISPSKKKLKTPVLDLQTVNGQLQALRNPAINVRYIAMLNLRKQGEIITTELSELLKDLNPFIAARALWILADIGPKGKAVVWQTLDHPEPLLRVTAIRALRQAGEDAGRLISKMKNDSSAMVRRELIHWLKETSPETKKQFLPDLAKGYRSGDRWYLEAMGTAMENESAWWYDTLKHVLASAKTDPVDWPQEMADITWRLHPPNAIDDCMKRIRDTTLAVAERIQMLTALAFIPERSSVQHMFSLTRNTDSTISATAVYWLSFRQGNEWYALADWSKIPVNAEYERHLSFLKVKQQLLFDERQSDYERRSATRAMAMDSTGGKMLIALAAAGRLPEKIKTFAGEFIFRNPDAAIRIQSGRYFRRPGATIVYNIDSLLSLKKDAEHGKTVFMKTCSICHQYNNTGNAIGPNLSAIHTKFGSAALIESVINPDGAIGFGYESWVATTTDGQSVYGLLLSRDAQSVVMKDASGEKHRLRTENLKSMVKQDRSLMPDAAAMGLSSQDLADITAFLLKGNQ